MSASKMKRTPLIVCHFLNLDAALNASVKVSIKEKSPNANCVQTQSGGGELLLRRDKEFQYYTKDKVAEFSDEDKYFYNYYLYDLPFVRLAGMNPLFDILIIGKKKLEEIYFAKRENCVSPGMETETDFK